MAELEPGGVSQNGDLFELNPASGTGPLLELNGSVVTKGQFGAAGWTPVGALQTGNGYEVAFSNGKGQYVVWNTDSNGDFTGDATRVLSANSSELEGVEAAFGETFTGRRDAGDGDPDCDFERHNDAGTATLAAVRKGALELNPAERTGPLLELNGSVVTTSHVRAAGWTPVGAVQTGTGTKSPSKTARTSMWSGTPTATATSPATPPASCRRPRRSSSRGWKPPLATRTSPRPDAGDAEPDWNPHPQRPAGCWFGQTAVRTRAAGGPLLEEGGIAVTAGSLGGWTPVGAEQTATGYEVVWSLFSNGESQDTYTVWNTDSGGNYTSSALGLVSGQNFSLEDLNPVFGENVSGAPSLSAFLGDHDGPNRRQPQRQTRTPRSISATTPPSPAILAA